jgi:hypothetical protein
MKKEGAMKLTMTIGAAMGLAALTGCSQSGQDNVSTDANAEVVADETVLPPDESAGATDTLGNQLDQLNETGQDNMSNATENNTNSY